MSRTRAARRLLRPVMLLASLIVAALALAGCGGAIGAGAALRSDPAAAQRLGDQLHPELVEQFGGRAENRRVAALVSEIGARLAASQSAARARPGDAPPPQRWTFTVLDSALPNAFALPGGYVYVTRGLLPFLADEDALAAALAHEMGHVTRGHYLHRLEASRRGLEAAASAGRAAARAGAGRAAQSEAAAMAWIDYVASFSREQELEADRISVRSLALAGYDPGGQASLIRSLQAIEALEARTSGVAYRPEAVDWYSLHPSSGERLRLAVAEAQAQAAARAPRDPGAAAARLLAAVDGMRFGDSPEDGVVRDRAYLDPVRGVAFTVPAGYTVARSAGAVIALAEDGPAITFFGGEERHDGALTALLQEISDEAVRYGDAPLEDITGFRVNGLDAASAIAREVSELPGFEAQIIAIRVDARIHFIVAFYSADAAATAAATIRETIASFRRLTAAERASIKSLRVEVVRVRAGDSVARLARRMAVDDAPEALFRALNGLGADARLTAGEPVKIVVDARAR